METTAILKNIIQIRNAQELTKKKVAEKLSMSEATYGRIENGKIALTYIDLARIASALGMSVIDVITYPDKYIKAEQPNDEPVEAILQIKLTKEKKDQVLKFVFGENNIEILNK